MADKPWVLNLSTNPPSIYNDTISEHAHNALDTPYPKVFWGVNQAGDDVVHPGEKTPHSPCFDTPYPIVFWYVNQAGNDVVHDGETTPHSPCFTNPFPYVFWYVNQAGNDVIHDNLYNYTPMGACYNCPNLTNITIPTSVKHIGPNMATNTGLTSVTIASDCEYDSTSFPPGCTVNFYPA